MQQPGTAAWFHHTNIYEVNLRQYTREGTINAFAAHLPRLKDMGIQTLWFMPITPIAQLHKKGSLGSYYACSDYTGVDPEFGTLEDFQKLVARAHEMGFRVILDWVANHTGWDHRWTREHPEYFKRTGSGELKAAAGMDDIIELDHHNPELRKAMIAAMRWWLDQTGIDGFRCDLSFWVMLDFWKAARTELDPERKLFWFGEHDPLVHPEYMQVFDAAYSWTWMQEVKEYYHDGKPLAVLHSILGRYAGVAGDTAWFTTNHDENSWNGTEYEKYGHAALALAVFSCTWPGIPLIYSGQEIPNKKRLAFFDKDPLEWPELPRLHGFYKTLLELQMRHPAFADRGAAPVILATDQPGSVLAFLRRSTEGSVLVVLNLSHGHKAVCFLDDQVQGEFRQVFSGLTDHFKKGKLLHLEGWGYRVYEGANVQM